MAQKIKISNSQIKLWRRCQQAYYYKEVEGLARRVKSLPLERGVLLHSLIEDYYLGKDWRRKLKKYEKKFLKMMEEERELYGDLPADAERLMLGYEETYDLNQEEVICVEQDFYKEPVLLEDNVYLGGVVDRVVRDKSGLWLVETKTHKKIPSETDRFINIQTSIYIHAMEKRMPELKFSGVLWDYLRTKPPTVPKVLKDGSLSKAQNIDTDYSTFMKAIKDNGLDPKDYREQLERAKANPYFIRRYMPRSDRVISQLLGEVVRTAKEINKLQHYPYRNFDKFTCQGCEFRMLCEAELLGLDSSFIRKAEYTNNTHGWGGENIEKKSKKSKERRYKLQ